MNERILNLKSYIEKLNASLQTKWQELQWAKKSFFVLTIIYLIALSSLFRADYNYIDDSGRVISGYRGWDNWSRYLSNFLSSILHTNKYLTDISPVPQIIAVIFIVLAGLCIIYIFNRQRKFRLIELMAVVPLGLNPWFLECFSYKFDSPYMALSVFASVIPFIWWGAKKKFCIISILGILVMDMTYQASSGIYIIMTLSLLLQDWLHGKSSHDIKEKIISSLSSYVVAMLVFRIVFMKEATDYVTTQTATLATLPQIFLSNLQQYFSFVKSDLNHITLILILLIIVSSLIIFTYKRKNKNKFITCLIVTLSIALQAIFSYGGYLFLQQPLFAPRAMYGFGVFLTITTVMALTFVKNSYLFRLEIICLSWCMIVLSLTYGNALSEQKRYTDFRIQMVIEDYNHLTQNNLQSERWIQLDGNIGKTEGIHKMEKKYPSLKRLIPSTFGGEWWWNKDRFFHYFNIKAKSWDKKEQGDMKKMNLPTVIDTEYYKIQSDGTHILITLHE